MTSPIPSITTEALGLALDAAALRHQAIAANIANHATEGYLPMKVDFASQMEGARRALDAQGRLDARALADVQPRMEPALDADGLPMKVHLDKEVADMAENNLRFQTLAKGLSRHFAILSSAVNDGKR